MRELNDNIVPVRAAATITTPAVPALNLFAISAQIAATGAPGGTMKLQASNDAPVAANAVPINWNDIPSASIAVTGTGSFMIPKTDLCYQYIRVVYTNTGTGTVSIVIKALGA